jgi:Histidine kinase-, DNA gyrase B-, and HSP90-like ATPase
LPSHCLGDVLRLKQVLNNLLDNAVKFTAVGRIEFHVALDAAEPSPAANLAAAAAVPRRLLRFTVADSGCGIAAEKLAAVFEPFVQEDHSITRRFGGTGLGLAITAKLVERMQGQISLHSQLGAGSVFEFSLPLLVPGPLAAAAPRAADIHGWPADGADIQPLKGLRVLLVDDDPVNRIVGEAQLRRMGAEIVLAVMAQRPSACSARKPIVSVQS